MRDLPFSQLSFNNSWRGTPHLEPSVSIGCWSCVLLRFVLWSGPRQAGVGSTCLAGPVHRNEQRALQSNSVNDRNKQRARCFAKECVGIFRLFRRWNICAVKSIDMWWHGPNLSNLEDFTRLMTWAKNTKRHVTYICNLYILRTRLGEWVLFDSNVYPNREDGSCLGSNVWPIQRI